MPHLSPDSAAPFGKLLPCFSVWVCDKKEGRRGESGRESVTERGRENEREGEMESREGWRERTMKVVSNNFKGNKKLC